MSRNTTTEHAVPRSKPAIVVAMALFTSACTPQGAGPQAAHTGSTTTAHGTALAVGFAPNPLVIETGSVKYDTDMGKKGWNECGYKETTEEPAATFELTEAHRDLELRLEGSHGVLVGPTGKIACLDTAVNTFATWPAGTYRYHPIQADGADKEVSTRLVFIAPERAAKEAVFRLETVIAQGGELNPSLHEVKVGAGPVVRTEHLGIEDCTEERKVALLAPVGKLEVKQPSSFTVHLDTKQQTYVYVRKADGTCQRGAENLPTGTHEIWASVAEGAEAPTQWNVSLFDREQAYALGEAKTYQVDDPSKPITIRAHGHPSEFGASCGAGARKPTFYLKAPKRIRRIDFALMFASEPAELAILGPLEKQFGGDLRCKSQGSHELEWMEGTYAVFVGSEKGAEVVTLLGEDKGLAPLDTVKKAAENPSLADREYAAYYPYYGRLDGLPVEALFIDAPKQLFVFTKRSAKGLVANAPLLLVDHGDEESTVVSLDGKHHKLRTSDLATRPNGAVALPTVTPPPVPKDFAWATTIAGPVERQELIAPHEKAKNAFHSCVVSYMKKNDPSWGKDYELVYVRSGKNVSQVKFAEADRKCGYENLKAKGNAVAKKVHASRVRAQKDALASLAKKLD